MMSWSEEFLLTGRLMCFQVLTKHCKIPSIRAPENFAVF